MRVVMLLLQEIQLPVGRWRGERCLPALLDATAVPLMFTHSSKHLRYLWPWSTPSTREVGIFGWIQSSTSSLAGKLRELPLPRSPQLHGGLSSELFDFQRLGAITAVALRMTMTMIWQCPALSDWVTPGTMGPPTVWFFNLRGMWSLVKKQWWMVDSFNCHGFWLSISAFDYQCLYKGLTVG